MSSLFRSLPAVNDLLALPEIQSMVPVHGHQSVVDAIRDEIDQLRSELKAGASKLPEPAEVVLRVQLRIVRNESPRMRTVVNATGIVLHTNLGRSPIAEAAAHAAYEAAHGYLNLELDLETGKRSSRQDPIREAICPLLGCESATVVNNCAAATVIVLRALAAGKEVIVSRGQLVEIGGSFRVPEIMEVSGARLREVGTTNITRIADYERAIGPNTAMLMRIHHSNYRISGFTEVPTLEELVALGKKHQIPVVDDAGSGALIDFARFGLPGDPVIGESIQQGADLVLFSGDKLLGGPQAGLICGRKSLVQRIEKDPLMRAFRLDKMTLAALEATLRLYRDPDRLTDRVPILRMLSTPIEELHRRAESVAMRLREVPSLRVFVEETSAFVGGGSLPDLPLKSVVVAVQSSLVNETDLATKLRLGEPAILARVADGRVLFDVRTIFATQEAALANAVRRIVHL